MGQPPALHRTTTLDMARLLLGREVCCAAAEAKRCERLHSIAASRNGSRIADRDQRRRSKEGAKFQKRTDGGLIISADEHYRVREQVQFRIRFQEACFLQLVHIRGCSGEKDIGRESLFNLFADYSRTGEVEQNMYAGCSFSFRL